ncbi:hypothetical protein QYF50_15540 [Paenibacillus vini]|uniref:hypothetical protein n=1 Tax=Paenibacillus vini TaxID=1476024 RepID=UPI0025B73191|nr:hypothetical protein [Paenibacillus vini]MDN4069265.1 hypothetical protein [Paenibacillus vini]MDN4069318.1 hypothetical protein [Paenibacillus vini]
MKEFAGKNRHNQATWLCECECGTLKTVRGSGKIDSRSCGCLQRETAAKTLASVARKHGDFGTPLYRVWAAMRSRCQNKNTVEYRNYGGRGVKVFQSWNEYEDFKRWSLISGYQHGLTLDRIDYNGNYEPNNCRWITIQDQQRNRRDNIWINVEGKPMIIAEISRLTGILDKTLYSRYKKGARSFEELTSGVGNGSFFITKNMKVRVK